MNKLIILLFITASLFCACGNKNTSTQNTSYIYNNDPTTLFPSFLVYHKNTQQSELYIELNSKQLLYAKRNGSDSYKANLLVKYKLFAFENSKNIIDSGSVIFEHQNEENNNNNFILTEKIVFKAASGNKYYLHCFAFDNNKEQFFETKILVDKTTVNNSQNFLILDSTGKVCFFPYLEQTHKFTVKYNRPLNKIYVSFFENNYPPALPPFSIEPLPTFAFKPNRREELILNNDSSFTFYAEEEGIFHFQTDTGTYDGISVFNFGNKFPRVTEPEKMVEPVRYISSKNEYSNILNSNQPKTALDLFWISIAGNYERGRQIIKEYYTRVENANKLFSSFQEGWKTDRGIIYVVFGNPNLIYKNENTEKWVYGEENNALSVVFEFNKLENPFSKNDYVLTRNPIHKNAWYRAVEAWRQGRIY